MPHSAKTLGCFSSSFGKMFILPETRAEGLALHHLRSGGYTQARYWADSSSHNNILSSCTASPCFPYGGWYSGQYVRM